MTNFYGVLSTHIDEVWGDVLPYLKATLAHPSSRHDVGSIWKALHEQDMQLWVAYDEGRCTGFCITQIINYPVEKSCQVIFGGGILEKSWQDFLLIIEEWANSNACHSVEVLGRLGWNKVFKPIGYDLKYAVVAKRLCSKDS